MTELHPDLLRALLAQGESQTVEFKTELARDADVARLVSGLANAEGGVLIIGVAGDGHAVGLSESDADEAYRRLRNIANRLLSWPTTVGKTQLDGRTLVYHVVPPAPPEFAPVVTASGDVYIRRDQRTDRVSLKEISTGTATSPEIGRLGFGGHSTSFYSTRGDRDGDLTLYVGMSYREEEEPHLQDYLGAIERSAAQLAPDLRINVRRTDSGSGDEELSRQVLADIDSADIVLCDFTLNPRNVYYELGYARGKGKITIQTARRDTQLEFNVRNIRTVIYRNGRELEAKLQPELQAACQRIRSSRTRNEDRP